MPQSATEARTRLGFNSGMNSTQTTNYHGSSDGMEMTAAEILWERSVESHRFRYTTMLSDGDCEPTSTCVICACMAVMSILQRRNA